MIPFAYTRNHACMKTCTHTHTYTYRDAQRKERVEVLNPDMRRVRERQQAEALRKATEGAKQGKAM